jgi:hypothetical protein
MCAHAHVHLFFLITNLKVACKGGDVKQNIDDENSSNNNRDNNDGKDEPL